MQHYIQSWTELEIYQGIPQAHRKVISIPNFPIFRKLELEDKDYIDSFVSKHVPYSDFNFTSLWCYNTNDDIEFTTLNNNLVIKFRDYVLDERFLTFLGHNELYSTIKMLLEYAIRNKDLAQELRLIPDVSIETLSKLSHNFRITEDIDNHDYIFSVKEHAELTGNKYSDKRNLTHRFKNRYEDTRIELIDIVDHNVQSEIINFFDIWKENSDKDESEVKKELIALKRLFKHSTEFSLISHGVYLKNKLIGFSICEPVHNKYVITHFEKVDVSIMGVSSFLRNEIAKYLNFIGYDFINYEQDLGIISLRKAKSLWKPIHYLKKYRISY